MSRISYRTRSESHPSLAISGEKIRIPTFQIYPINIHLSRRYNQWVKKPPWIGGN